MTVIHHASRAQCPGAMGDQTTYGSDAWIGYVYEGMANFNSADYQGYITQSENFDQSFCGDNCNFTTNGCDVNTETFTVRYKMQKNYTCGTYRITVGGDDGIRLSLDGGSTYVINDFGTHAYTSYTLDQYLSGGTYDVVFEYFENTGQNRVTFNSTFLGSNYGGEISGDQTYCGASTVDPTAFSSTAIAAFCTGSSVVNYQWQVSSDNSSWSDIPGATSTTYDIGAGYSGLNYYRRQADDGIGNFAYTNTLTVHAQSPTGDQVSYGDESWIGYVYDGANNFTDYKGEIFESETFDESFGGDDVYFSTSGCDVYTETYTVRFKMRKDFLCGDFTFTIGADDGVRLSLDGGSTYLIDYYTDHSYATRSSTSVHLEGTYDLVLDFYENGGGNRVSFSYTVDGNCSLPVRLANFKATPANDETDLTWTTTSEINNDYFQVERSTDGIAYQAIGTVTGHGHSVHEIDYDFTDPSPAYGVNYYRLKQVDFDGKFVYSNIITAETSSNPNFQLYPNPAANVVKIKYEGPFIHDIPFTISNVQGYILKSGTIRQIEEAAELHVGELAKGMYIISFRTGDQSVRKQLLIDH